jgi:acetyl-CoA carboxylase biotin carboxylase subunit
MKTRRSIEKILIANRGEIALRIMRTCREMGIRTVAVCSEADRAAPHVMAADESVCIGPPPSRESYLAAEKIIAAALRTGADAVHPGYGFLSENASFARDVAAAGLVFVGPRPESIAAMGDKTAARKLVSSAGVPTVPGTDDVVDLGSVEEFCARHGFPILLKAAAGGGGKGMRVVQETGELEAAFAGARSEARSAFGDDRVYAEKYLDAPRHIEMQILADRKGNTVHLGERECTIQRRHQKVIEETPSVIVDEAMRAAMGETAVKVAQACGYENAGTIEFLVDQERKFYFLEMNTRLQVEHPVTELCTGLDLVELQIRIARGESLPFRQHEVTLRGHAIECRICAEDVESNFLPATGRILHLKTPSGPGIREDRGIEQGGEISVYYDSMIAKLAVWAPDRTAALARMARALKEYELLGVTTTIPLCRFVIGHPRFAAGEFTTNFISEEFSPGVLQGQIESLECAAAAVSAFIVAAERQPPPGSANGNHSAGRHWRLARNDHFREP